MLTDRTCHSKFVEKNTDVSQKWYLRMQRRKRVGCLRKERQKQKKTKECERKEKRASEQQGTESVLLHQLFGQLPVG